MKYASVNSLSQIQYRYTKPRTLQTTDRVTDGPTIAYSERENSSRSLKSTVGQ